MTQVRWLLLVSLVFLSACGRSETSPLDPMGKVAPSMVEPGEPRSGGGKEDGVVVIGPPTQPPSLLTPPSQSQWVVVYDPEEETIENIAAGLSMTVVKTYGYDLALLEETAAYSSTLGPPPSGVVVMQTNDPANMTHSQDLVFGFYEGWLESEVNEQYMNTLLDFGSLHAKNQGQGIKVAILDTGADVTHSWFNDSLLELAPQLPLQSREIYNGIDDDENGTVDDGKGHGTVCASIIKSVAPLADILPIQILSDEGIGSVWDLTVAMEIARWQGCNIVNMSLSLSAFSPVVEHRLNVLEAAGVSVICATGNQSTVVSYPASSAKAIGVAASDDVDDIAYFSNTGVGAMFAAPGVAIVAAYPEEGMVSATGTSMACPVAAATLALVASYTSLTTFQAMSWIVGSVVPVDPSGAVEQGRVSPLGALLDFDNR